MAEQSGASEHSKHPQGIDMISKFLNAADLESFEAAFEAEGVTKIEHIIDVIKEDLQKIGEGVFYDTRAFSS